MKQADVESIEIQLFLDALRLRHGYDFRDYARSSLKRRLRALTADQGFRSLSELLPRLLHDGTFLPEIIASLSVPVTEMFRDPEVFRSLRVHAPPLLRSYGYTNIWQAGCATGEEVYSLAILLKEENLYGRAQIYATDINGVALAKAEEAVFPIAPMKAYSENYTKSGGLSSLSDYYIAKYHFAKMDDSLKENILFTHHNLAMDGPFCEMHLILCRNVLIYFNRTLQNRVLRLFRDSLARGGILCLGAKETLEFSDVADDFVAIDLPHRIFRRKSGPPAVPPP
ncbi:MAG: protein-glutamate O-methyltransferase CheR [Alphaproteobacteria bacterium]|nr:protein-glutamate O-methyltransferase CheR [Alphaproteobacteria bacterium]